MTKGVPSELRSCVRCGKVYQPASGPQRYCSECIPIMHKVYTGQWGRRHPERRRQISEKSWNKNPERLRRLRKYNFYMYRERLTNAAMEHYSGAQPRCACCGETERDFLVMDHVEGHGNEHRRKTFGRIQGGWQFYKWLVKEGFPQGFQVLCYNCNASKGKHGKCVHVARPVPPLRPLDVKCQNPHPELKPRGDEASFVRWRPRTWEESQAFKESSKAGKNSS